MTPLANIAVVLAAVGVAAFESIWPDVLVGLAIASLNIWGATVIFRRSMASGATPQTPACRRTPERAASERKSACF